MLIQSVCPAVVGRRHYRFPPLHKIYASGVDVLAQGSRSGRDMNLLPFSAAVLCSVLNKHGKLYGS